MHRPPRWNVASQYHDAADHGWDENKNPSSCNVEIWEQAAEGSGLLECQRVEPWAREFLKSERNLRTIGLLGSCSMSTQKIEWYCSTVS